MFSNKLFSRTGILALTLVVLGAFFISTSRAFAATTATLTPTGNGSQTAWTGSSGEISETGTVDCVDNSDDGDDNVASMTTNARESVNLDESSIPNGSTITSIEVFVWDQGATTTGGTYKTFVRDDNTSTNNDATAELSVTSSSACTAKSQVIDVVDFVKTSSTDLEVGVLKTATNGSKVWIGAIRAIVTYTPMTVAATASANGTIDPAGTTIVETNDDLDFTITPNSNYIVADVLVDGATQGRVNEYDFDNISASHTISATFENGWSAPTTNANTSGVSNADRAYSSNDSDVAFDDDNDTATYGGFGYSLASNAVINGIQVAIEGERASGGTRTLSIALSWDGGTSWTSASTASFISGQESTVVLGGASNTWGRTWIPAELTNANFKVKATAGTEIGDMDVDQLQVKVTSVVNTAPVATDSSDATSEDTPKTVTMQASDADVGNTLTYTIVTPPTNGSLGTVTGNTVEYTPNANFNGSDSFTFKVNDGTADSNTATVSLTVSAVNDAPDAIDDSTTTDEEVAVVVSVLTNDSDPESNALSITGVTQGTKGAVVNNGDGTVTYTPTLNKNGSDSFTYTISDGSDTDTATVNVTITPVNDVPTANADAYSADEDTPLSVDAASGVLDNDVDLEGDSLTATLVSDVSNGTLSLASDGSFTYTPDAGYVGSDSFTYTANDAGTSNTATVSITVSNVNDAPVAVADAQTVNEDGTLTIAAPGLLANDTDVENDPLTAAVEDAPTKGSVTVNADGSFEYTPNTDENGTDTFTYKANDGSLTSGEGLVTITITPVNDTPVAAADSYTVNEDTQLTGNVVTNDTDVDLDTLSATLASDVSNGTLVLNTDGSFTYDADANYHGSDSFTYTVGDGTVDGNTVTVSITVSPVNDAPTATDDSYTSLEDTTLTTTAIAGVLANDADVDSGDSLVVSAVNGNTGNVGVPISLGSGATLTVNADGSFTYVPAANFVGVDTFTYTAKDTTTGQDIGTVTVTIGAVNDAPSFTAGSNQTVMEDSGAQTVLAWATATSTGPADESSQTLTFSTTNDFNALFSVQPSVSSVTGDLTYTPAPDAYGTANVTVTLTDNGGTANGGSDTFSQTFTITVTPGPAPVFNAPIAVGTTTDTSLTITWGTEQPATSRVVYDTVSHDPVGAAPNYGYVNSTVEDPTKVTSHSVTITGLTPGTQYFVRAISRGSPESTSSETSGTTTSAPASGGGNAVVGGNGPIVGAIASGGQVLGASIGPSATQGEVLGASTSCSASLTSYLRRGSSNAAEVKKLQEFLNKEMNAGLPVTGFFGPLTEAAVKAFQTKYAADVLAPWGITAPTGYVYKLTQWKINMILCATLNAPKPQV